MSTNANVFNSRVTSEALEAKFRQVFPAQAGAELIQDLYASGVIQPVIDFSSVAEGSVLSQNLQTAWDFATLATETTDTSDNIATTPGFYRVQGVAVIQGGTGTGGFLRLYINDGATSKSVWGVKDNFVENNTPGVTQFDFNVFLRTGDTLIAQSNIAYGTIETFIRQIADVNGNLVNPLGFTFQ